MMGHLTIMPIILPVLALVAALLAERRGIGAQRAIAWVATLLQWLVSIILLVQADDGVTRVYLLGGWESWLGIALAVDRLSALMLATTTTLALASLAYACSGWDQRAPHFHALFQAQLMGLAGAFLTADLFNLFVFFEVLLIASYGLMLSGGRGPALRAGLHYVAFNVAASTLYLFAIGLLFGLLGALNMAEMAQRIAVAPAADLPLIQAAGGLLLVVFCAKAALFPLHLWLPETYRRTPAPVLVLFAIMTKLGVYAVLRVFGTLFGADAGELAGFAWPWLIAAAALGLPLAALGALAASSLHRLTAWLVVSSAATLFLAIGFATPETVGAGLYYLVQSAFAAAALFLLGDTIARQRHSAGDSLRTVDRVARRAALGLLFLVVAIWLAGMPPLAGFIGKVALLAAIPEAAASWAWSLILVAGLLTLIALSAAGSHLFWREDNAPPTEERPPHPSEYVAIMLLLALSLALSVFAEPLLRYSRDAAGQALSPVGYHETLLGRQAGPETGGSP